jgi:membrane protease YdiL (CAAX protease family)
LAAAAAGTLALPLQLLAWRGLLATVQSPPTQLTTSRRAAREIRVAYLSWLVITPVVYVVALAALWLYSVMGGQAEQHPLLRVFETTPVPAGAVLLLLSEAVIAAPIREELLFRGILLPWLRGRPWRGDIALVLAAAVGVALRPTANGQWTDAAALASRFGPALLVMAMAPLARPVAEWPKLRRLLPIRDDQARAQAIRAIVGSAAIFACVHSNVWPTPIPLAVLALALGWLAMRTQGIVGPVVVHILFNAVAFVELGID